MRTIIVAIGLLLLIALSGCTQPTGKGPYPISSTGGRFVTVYSEGSWTLVTDSWTGACFLDTNRGIVAVDWKMCEVQR